MNREDIIRMAREAGIDKLNGFRDDNTASVYYEAWPEQLERFAALVAAAEREACAKWLEDVVDAPNWAKQIRARGNT